MVALLLASFASAVPVQARAGDPWLSVQLGGSIPMGDLHDGLAPGLAGGLSLTAKDRPDRGMGIQVAYHAWGTNDALRSDVLDFFAPGWSFRLHAIQTTAFVLTELPPAGGTTPYVRVGGGLYWLRSRLDTSFGDHEDTEYCLGYNAGAGLRFPLGSEGTVGLEGTFHAILFDGNDWRGVVTLGMNVGLF